MVSAYSTQNKHYWIDYEDDEEIKTENGVFVTNLVSTPGKFVEKNGDCVKVECIVTGEFFDLEEAEEVDQTCLGKYNTI